MNFPKIFLFLFFLASLAPHTGATLASPAYAQTQAETRYRIFDAKGQARTMEDVLAALDAVEVVCVGELHNDATAHVFEAELFKRMLAREGADRERTKARRVVLSLEMFERDVQIVLDEYLGGLIAERHFLLSTRPWNNYQTDYRPLVELAREQGSAVIAANAPARYVNRVSRLGPDSLKQLTAARAWLPPLPYQPASAAYAAKFKRLMSGPHMTAAAPASQSPHGNAYLLDAQVLRDATMAHAITQQLKQQAGALVLHVGGSFHSEEQLGLPEQIRHYRPKTRTLVITIVPDKGYPEFDAARLGKLGDFVVVTDPTAQRTQ